TEGRGAAYSCEDSRFEKNRRHEPPAARAEGLPDRHLVAASMAADEREGGEVGAGDQEKQNDSAREDPQRRPRASDDLVGQSEDGWPRELAVLGGVALSKGLGDRCELRRGLRRFDAGLEPAEHAKEVRSALRMPDVRGQRDGDGDFGVVGARKEKLPREY